MTEDQEPDRRSKGYILRRSVMDYGMGVIIFCLGIFFSDSEPGGCCIRNRRYIPLFIRRAMHPVWVVPGIQGL